MSLSLARPIVTEPASLPLDADLCDMNFMNRVAKFDASADPALTTVVSLGGAESGDGAQAASTTVISLGGGDSGAAC